MQAENHASRLAGHHAGQAVRTPGGLTEAVGQLPRTVPTARVPVRCLASSSEASQNRSSACHSSSDSAARLPFVALAKACLLCSRLSAVDSLQAFCFRLLPEPLARNLHLRIVCNIRIEQTHVQHDENHRVFAANGGLNHPKMATSVQTSVEARPRFARFVSCRCDCVTGPCPEVRTEQLLSLLRAWLQAGETGWDPRTSRAAEPNTVTHARSTGRA